MVTHAKFRASLYEYHLEEASFQYALRVNPADSSLDDLHELEERLEAHIDALVLGGDLALDVCRRQTDFGEIHTALCVFCRAGCKQDVERLATEIDWEDQDIAAAFSDALAHELPESWSEDVKRWLQNGSEKFKGALARAVGEKRWPLGPAVAAAAQEISDANNLPPFLKALAYLDEKNAVMLCFRCMQQPRYELARAGALAALRLATQDTLTYLRQAQPSWAAIPLSIAGNARDYETLLRLAPTRDGLIALGLLGKCDAIPILRSFLDHEELSSSAAAGLYLLLGEETHGDRFSSSHRYRLGELYSSDAAIKCLQSTKLSTEIRQFVSDELCLRYGLKMTYIADVFVREQLKQIAASAADLRDTAKSFQPGRWLLNGHYT